MLRAWRLTLAIVVGLAVLTLGASTVLQETTRAWFEHDLTMRAALAVRSARAGLVGHLPAGDRQAILSVLGEIALDERVAGSRSARPTSRCSPTHRRIPTASRAAASAPNWASRGPGSPTTRAP